MKNLLFIAFALLGLASCSDRDEPKPDTDLHIAEITDGATNTQKISYDAKRRGSLA